ncbi:O-antigen ligase family protein [Clostridium butyricum]|uniref:O-antigen ligase family protein n=1 Tax=Clostridium butyricum TaxID=1492 RepID=UPI000482750E|nr:O-antigen ligase family protein [Clostridium butyricum]
MEKYNFILSLKNRGDLLSDNKNSKIIKTIIVTYPLWDMILTITSKLLNISLPINQVARLIIMIYFFRKIKNRKQIVSILILFVLLFCGEATYIMRGNNILGDIAYILKILFFVICIYSFDNMLENKIISREELIQYIVLSGFLITVSIIISPFGLGFKSWDNEFRSGYKGLFMGQNLVTATLLIINPLNMYLILKTKKFRYYILYLMNFLSLLLIGTKSGLVGAIVLLVFELLILIKYTKRNFLKYSLMCFMLPIIFFLMYLSKEYFIKFFTEQINLYQQMNFTNLSSFLISNRDLQTIYIKDYIFCTFNYNPIFLFGLGYSQANHIINMNKSSFQAIEMDLQGILYYSGLWILLYIIVLIGKRTFYSISNLIKNKFQIRDYFIIFSIVIGSIHAVFGGHVIYEALTSLYFAASLSLAKNIKRDNEEVKDE